MSRLTDANTEFYVSSSTGIPIRISRLVFLRDRGNVTFETPKGDRGGFYFVSPVSWSVDLTGAREFLHAARLQHDRLTQSLHAAAPRSWKARDLTERLQGLALEMSAVEHALPLFAGLEGCPLCMSEADLPKSPDYCEGLLENHRLALHPNAGMDSWYFRLGTTKAQWSVERPEGLLTKFLQRQSAKAG